MFIINISSSNEVELEKQTGGDTTGQHTCLHTSPVTSRTVQLLSANERSTLPGNIKSGYLRGQKSHQDPNKSVVLPGL